MEYNDRRLAELASLDAHRRAAQSNATDPAVVFRLGTFTHTMAQELLVESIVSYREAIQRLETKNDRGEAWERANALIAFNQLMLGDRARAKATLDALLLQKPESVGGNAMLAEYYFREGNDTVAREILAKIPEDQHGHPIAGAILLLHNGE